MAINPNVDFVAGAILTAAQQNRFPRGVMQLKKETSNFTFSTGAVSITAASFTAVANRYYRLTYMEPSLPQVQNSNTVSAYIQVTNTAGAILGQTDYVNTTAVAGARGPMTLVAYATFSAGSVVIVGSLNSPGASVTAVRNANMPAVLIIEDIGPA